MRSVRGTIVPDDILDSMANFTEAQLRVLLYVARRTSGYQREWDHISAEQLATGVVRKKTGEQLDTGTGLTRRAIRRAVAQLTDPSQPGAPPGGPWLVREFQQRPNGSPAANAYRLAFDADESAEEEADGTDSRVRRGYGLRRPEGTDSRVRRGGGGGTDSRVRTNNKQGQHADVTTIASVAPTALHQGTAPEGGGPIGAAYAARGEGEALPQLGEGAAALNGLGMPKPVAAQLAQKHGEARCLEVAIAAKRARIARPAAWARRGIEEGWDVSAAAQRAARHSAVGATGGEGSAAAPAGEWFDRPWSGS